jgi:hypothetical protein
MKIGKERPLLSDQVRSQLEQEITRAAGSMAWRLRNFERDCSSSLKTAEATISKDLADLQHDIKEARTQTLEEVTTNLDIFAKISRIGPMFVMIGVALLLWSCVLMSWVLGTKLVKLGQADEFRRSGFQQIKNETEVIYIWDRNRLELSSCTAGEKSLPCLIEKQKQ